MVRPANTTCSGRLSPATLAEMRRVIWSCEYFKASKKESSIAAARPKTNLPPWRRVGVPITVWIFPWDLESESATARSPAKKGAPFL